MTGYIAWCAQLWALVGNHPVVQAALAQGGGCTGSAEECLFVAYGDAAHDSWKSGLTPAEAADEVLSGMWA